MDHWRFPSDIDVADVFKKLNDEQRAAVLCRNNAVTAAGAGSGKTYVLACRYTFLILNGIKMEQILALTFTNKAVAEMYTRIYDQLSEIAHRGKGIFRERAQEAINSFYRARIQTLDSYCGTILMRSANRYGIPPDFVIDDGRCREMAEAGALPFVLAHRNNPGLRALFSLETPENLARSLFADTAYQWATLDGGIDFAQDAQAQVAEVAEQWGRLTIEITGLLENFCALWDADPPEGQLAAFAAPLAEEIRRSHRRLPKSADIHKFFAEILEKPPQNRRAIPQAVQKLLDLVIRFDRLPIRAKHPITELVKKMRGLTGLFSSVAIFICQGAALFSVFDLLAEFHGAFLRQKRNEGVLSFNDVARMARKTLIEQVDIRADEKAAYRAIMIDEFQDNNSLQRDLLFLLAEKKDAQSAEVPEARDLEQNKLFFVGDEKQSIYRFRGADVSVFRSLSRQMETDGAGVTLRLQNNYRSAPELIAWFNAFFGGTRFDCNRVVDPAGTESLGEYAGIFLRNDDVPPYEAAYMPVCAPPGVSGSAAGSPAPEIGLCILDSDAANDGISDNPPGVPIDQSLPDAESEAGFVAQKIRSLKESGAIAEYGDAAILLRSLGKLRHFEKQLLRLGIPYVSESIGSFFVDAPVNDILRFLRLVVFPGDRGAYSAVLCSPLVGMSYDSLAACMCTLSAAGQDVPPFCPTELSPDEQERYQKAGDLYRRLREKSRTASACELLTALWYDRGYRYETLWNSTVLPYRELYDYLFELARRCDVNGGGLSGFVELLSETQKTGERITDLTVPLERTGGVRIMSVHKSKGLQFPVVFLCGAGSHAKYAISEIVSVMERGGGKRLTVKLPVPEPFFGREKITADTSLRNNYFFEKAREEEKNQKRAELRRLLYVAMTRAESRIYLTGAFPLKTGGRPEESAFPRLKSAVEEKLAAQISRPGDTIIDNDTFFGLLLPALVSRLDHRGNPPPHFFPTLEFIPKLARSDASGPRHTAVKKNVRSKLVPLYRDAALVHSAKPIFNRIAPTALVENMDFFALGVKRLEYQADGPPQGRSDIFPWVNAADFGTIVHICASSFFAHTHPIIPSSISSNLTDSQCKALIIEGRRLLDNFLSSELGQMAQNAHWLKSEYNFRVLRYVPDNPNRTYYIEGVIDLLFETFDMVHVVDFKSDKSEIPSLHYRQMACYYYAAKSIRKKECRVWLYYVRSGHSLDVTENARRIIL
ncbi:MAG: UvrD-helicase domain-containing protein [Spirochaetaceae bacterium]|jgi:ATP-dependent helicase/nuclease subunit A|nr:UvrD-helicase domain-containing protein [Spirochaetaceae bacterium]